MRDVMRYSGIVTKVAAMRAKLLKPQDYERLASMNTVTDIIEYLKQTKSYGKFINHHTMTGSELFQYFLCDTVIHPSG